MITSPKLDVGLLGREEEGGKKLRGKGVGSLSPPARSCLAFHNSHSIPKKNGWFSSFFENRSLFTLFTVTDHGSVTHVGLRFRLIKRDCSKNASFNSFFILSNNGVHQILRKIKMTCGWSWPPFLFLFCLFLNEKERHKFAQDEKCSRKVPVVHYSPPSS